MEMRTQMPMQMIHNLNCDQEDNLYFNNLIYKFNLNKDHFIIKVNDVLSELFEDRDGTFTYVESMFDDLCYYYLRKPEEAELILILIDRMIHSLSDPKSDVEITLQNLLTEFRMKDNPTMFEFDEIGRIVNYAVTSAKHLSNLLDNLNKLKDKILRETGATFRSNQEYDPWKSMDGESIF